MVELDPSAELKAENARRIALLEANDIQWCAPPQPVAPASPPASSRLSSDEKVALFRRLFRGRFPTTIDSTGQAGFAGQRPSKTLVDEGANAQVGNARRGG